MANERRLIDANELTDRLNHTTMLAYPNLFPGLLEAVEIVDDSPTVDAVEVVRCKDCKHKGWIQEPCHGKSVDFCHIWDSCINDSGKDFCSYGERRTDG